MQNRFKRWLWKTKKLFCIFWYFQRSYYLWWHCSHTRKRAWTQAQNHPRFTIRIQNHLYIKIIRQYFLVFFDKKSKPKQNTPHIVPTSISSPYWYLPNQHPWNWLSRRRVHLREQESGNGANARARALVPRARRCRKGKESYGEEGYEQQGGIAVLEENGAWQPEESSSKEIGCEQLDEQ